MVYCIYTAYTVEREARDLDIIIRNMTDTPIYEQIKEQFKGHILQGTLKEGTMLPSMRLLDRDLRVSVITTKRAYEELEREGFITNIQGRGCFVAPRNLELAREQGRRQVEEYLFRAVEAAKLAGVSREEVLSALDVLYEEEGL